MYTETQQQLLQWDKRPRRAAQAGVPWGSGAAHRPQLSHEPPPGLLFYVLLYPDQPASITIVTIATIDTIATMLHGMGPFIKSVASDVCTQIICLYSPLLLNACRDHVDYVYFVTSEIFDNIKYPDLHPSIVYAYNRYINKYTVGRWRHGLSAAFAGGLSLHLTFSGNIFAT